MDSVAGVARVPPAPGVVVAPLGAAMLAASGAASIVAAGTASGKAREETGLAAITAVTTGAVVPPGIAVAGSGTGVAGADRGRVGLAARSLPFVGGWHWRWLGDGNSEEIVQQVEGHPSVGGPRAVHRTPT
jgi:hypothetical protein